MTSGPTNAGTEAFALTGKTALILGASGAIGGEIAGGFKAAGATVLLAGRNAGKLAATAERLGLGPDATFAADLRDVAALRALADRVAASHGVPDILVASQGTTVIKPAFDVTEAEYDEVVDTNLKSVFFACQAFGQGMAARGSGVIVMITSLAAQNGWALAAAYSASKWGVASLTGTLAAEWGSAGVRVNALSPGFFLTDLNREKMSAARKAEAEKRNAMQRMGELSELVGAAIFLASDAARFVTGATIKVDGGYLASGI